MKTSTHLLETGSKYFSSSIRHKIIIPYALLTVILAVLGVFVVTRLVAGSFEARLKNQLLEAGRVVADGVVEREQVRLETERTVANTIGVSQALIDRNFRELDSLITPLIINSKQIDSIIVVDTQGKEALRLQRVAAGGSALAQTSLGSGANFAGWPAVSNVLNDRAAETKMVQVALDPKSSELMIYTVGPIRTPEGLIGAVLVGTYLKKEINWLRDLALAEITLFDETGQVIFSTLVMDKAEAARTFQIFTPNRYREVIKAQQEVVFLDEIEGPEAADIPSDVETRGQNYRLAYAPFLLRGQVYGVFGVGLPTNFVTHTNDQSRNLLALIFSVGVVLVVGIGYMVSMRIIEPIARLVRTSQAIALGDLNQRSGMRREDEIGILAHAFDDMTGELQRLLKIQEEEASKLNAILSSIADGVIVQDPAGGILTMNPAARRILENLDGTATYAQLQKSSLGAGAEAQGQQAAALLNRLAGLAFHETSRFEVGDRVLSGLSAPVFTRDQTRLGSVVVLRDITREVESEKLKDDFISSLSHELRTPLTAIKGYNELLRMTAIGKLDQRQLDFIATIEKNVDDLLNLIQEVLDLSQIDAGNLGIDQEPVDLANLITTEVQQWQAPMQARQLTFSVRLAGGSLWVEGDWTRLTRVIHHLIRNARDYTLPGGKVEIRARRDNGSIVVDIEDTGVGIAEESQRFLFTRFFRAIHAESTYDVSGAGLGLYTSRAIIQAHGGRIWVRSQLNKGSMFSFELPALEAKANDESQQEQVGEYPGS